MRSNTERAYSAAIESFENWGGLLPASRMQLENYIDFMNGKGFSENTKSLRLNAVKRWNKVNGFDVPSVFVKKASSTKKAKPITIEIIKKVEETMSNSDLMTDLRDLSLILLGFFRGFRADELVRLNVQDVQIKKDGMIITLPFTKESKGEKSFFIQRLDSLCPVSAIDKWINKASISHGPLFRSINRWGDIGENGLHINSINPLLRSALYRAGICDAESYSSHSMRRGFATWANESGVCIHSIMGYIGWKTVSVAVGYADNFHERIRPVCINSLLTINQDNQHSID